MDHTIICIFIGYKVSNFIKKIGCYRCLKKPKKLKGLTMNLVQNFLNNVPTFRLFAFLQSETLWIALTYFGINLKITNLNSF